MSKTIATKEQVLQNLFPPISTIAGIVILVLSLINFIYEMEQLADGREYDRSWLTFPCFVIGISGIVLDSKSRKAERSRNRARLDQILDSKYNLKMKFNPILYTGTRPNLIPGIIPATREGIDTEVILTLSSDGTDVAVRFVRLGTHLTQFLPTPYSDSI